MMKRTLLCVLGGLISGMCGLELDEIIDNTVKNYRGMTSFYAEFEQVFCDEVSGTCASYSGKIFFMKPHSFRLEIDDPKKIYVGDSVTLWIYIPEENRAVKQSMTGMPFQVNPDMFLTDYEQRFDAELSGDTEKTYEITLMPIDDGEVYEKVVLSISKETFRITGLAVHDEIGSENKYMFEKFEINKKISKDVFTFKPPRGTQVDEF